MHQYFLFLEIKERDIVSLLTNLQNIFDDRKHNTNIHITVRGPYSTPIKKTVMKKYTELMTYDVLEFSGIGMFSNPEESVVYMSVNSPNLERIWYKPTYPKSRYGFNPHITLYRGNDADYAEKIYKFLSKENINLLCSEFEFTMYTSKQFRLLDYVDTFSIERKFDRLINSGRIKDGIFDRAAKISHDT